MSSPSRLFTVSDPRSRLSEIVHHVGHLLPAQGPIGVFICHNTLHAFQHLHFEEAVAAAAQLYGTAAFLSEEAYREHLRSGRILGEDIEAVLAREPNARVLPARLDRRMLRKILLLGAERQFDAATIEWHIEETGLLAADGARELFSTCLEFAEVRTSVDGPPARPRDGLLWQTGVDLDHAVHPLLIRLCAVYLDQGVAYWPMPNRERGFLAAVRDLLARPGGTFPRYLEKLGAEFRRQGELGLDAAEVVESALDRFAVPDEEWESFLQAELLALPGWAGMIHKLEQDQGLAPHVPLSCSLMEYLAVRLTIGLTAASALADPAEWRMPRKPAAPGSEKHARAADLLQAFQLLGLNNRQVSGLNPIARQALVDEIHAFDELERRRILHLAYELRHEASVLRPLARYRHLHPPAARTRRPAAQVIFCIDEREESIRRHLEEVAPDVETESAAGFFGVAMDYTGIDDARGAPLCPAAIKPAHAVRERAVEEHAGPHEIRKRRRRKLGKVLRELYVSSRSLARGWVATAWLGVLAFPEMALRLSAPLLHYRLRRIIDRALLPKPRTELSLERSEAEVCMTGQLLLGFAVREMVERVGGVLGPAGLHRGFGRLVVVLGHGSTSLNNPHASAYDCGACGGRRGGPNARVFAAMANHPKVRDGLRGMGIDIPDDTHFVGGYHDTCSDEIELFDLGCVPPAHGAELRQLRLQLDEARQLDALERARRFETADPQRPEKALKHVQERANHLAEPRPEYGHSTNAVCIVGRRSVTRGLFLDRRAFLLSYDAALDPENESLARLLGAAVPVCAGINLEYYFSCVDNEGYGCGSKLTHNVTGLIGVMDGHAGDLRTGLPRQVVEIHEPVRMLFVVETTPERVMAVIAANPKLSELIENRWIRLATLDPESGVVHVRRGRKFEKLEGGIDRLPTASRSANWFSGKRENLAVAHITAART